MKSNFKWVPVGLVAAALLAVPLNASAQQTPDYSYVGIGGGDNGFAINGKITIYDNVSLRPSVSTDFDFDDDEDVSYVLPVTYDFNAVDQNGNLYPFLGTGIGGDLGDDSTIEFALTGGADYRIDERWVANGTISYLPFADGDGDEEVSFVLSVGYIFGSN